MVPAAHLLGGFLSFQVEINNVLCHDARILDRINKIHRIEKQFCIIFQIRLKKPLHFGLSTYIPLMSLTPSTMLPLGTAAPDFTLPDTDGKTVSLADFKDKTALLVLFICNHCPYVKHLRAGLAQLARDYRPRGVAIIGINSNDVTNYPEDSPARMKEEAKSAGYLFPYLYDESQAVAKAYRAACTPDLYLFSQNRKLVYRGQFDDSRPGNGVPVTGKDLRAALDAVLAGKPVSPSQKASVGCNIKWKAGNNPDYF
jgi:peroxiredoxin